MRPEVKSFFHRGTWTITHVVRDPGGVSCATIDPVLDFDPKSGRTQTATADEVIAWVREQGLEVAWLLETHAHAEPGFATDGSQFDHLFDDDESFDIGAMSATAWQTPGHTPACSTYLVGDAAFVRDTVFMPDSDSGSARADFPGGDAATLYRSIKRILSLPAESTLYICHDYGPGGREFAWITTVAVERAQNPHVHDGISEQEFVRVRGERGAGLEVPNLLLPSVQVNMRAGRFPPPEANGVSYLKLPLNAL